MTRVTAPGAPKGKIDSYVYPTSAVQNEKKDWSLTVSNSGNAKGDVFGAIANKAGNPGRIIVTYAGNDYNLAPGERLLIYTTLDPGKSITYSGQVRFDTVGDYTTRLQAGHRDTTWVEDDYREVG